MKTIKLIAAFAISISISIVHANDFETEARSLANDLKTSLMKSLTEKISKEGPVKAIPFCHANVKPIAKSTAGDRILKFEFGRTSHKIRNKDNRPQSWADSYLKEFQGTFKGAIKKEFLVHRLDNSKKIFLMPLYAQAQCLTCHGESVGKEIKNKLRELYPADKATGFKLGEFRGFIWIKEK